MGQLYHVCANGEGWMYCVPNKGFATRQQAWQEMFEYIEVFYNRQRSWAISPLQTRYWCILTSPLNEYGPECIHIRLKLLCYNTLGG